MRNTFIARKPPIMQKAIWAILLVGFSSVATAEWTKAGTSKLDSTVYFDTHTLSRDGDTAQMWLLFDLAKPRKATQGAIHSFRSLQRFDCRNGRFWSISRVFYSGRMAAGKVVATDDAPYAWMSVIPGSGMEAILLHACGETALKAP